jgi:hypothetical protein
VKARRLITPADIVEATDRNNSQGASKMNSEIQNKPVTNLVSIKRGRGNPSFVKGRSGNPGGRPKLSDEQKQIKFDLVHSCRLLAPEALKVLNDLMEKAKQENVRLNAAQAIIERAYGKALQVSEFVQHKPDLEAMSPEDAYKTLIGDRSVGAR